MSEQSTAHDEGMNRGRTTARLAQIDEYLRVVRETHGGADLSTFSGANYPTSYLIDLRRMYDELQQDTRRLDWIMEGQDNRDKIYRTSTGGGMWWYLGQACSSYRDAIDAAMQHAERMRSTPDTASVR